MKAAGCGRPDALSQAKAKGWKQLPPASRMLLKLLANKLSDEQWHDDQWPDADLQGIADEQNSKTASQHC
jgi:hypothetical protein